MESQGKMLNTVAMPRARKNVQVLARLQSLYLARWILVVGLFVSLESIFPKRAVVHEKHEIRGRNQ